MPSAPLRHPVAALRRTAVRSLRARVAGDDVAARSAAIWGTVGPRWFSPTDPIWVVHADGAMFIGGIRSLLLQSLHPLAMAGVVDHSAYRDNPWTRVQNTSNFIAMTTYGTIPSAEKVISSVNRLHAKVVGTAADGRHYSALDPHLLRWIHIAEIETFLTCFELYGARTLTRAETDLYVQQAGFVNAKLGVVDPPTTRAQLHAELEAFRPELAATPGSRDVAHLLLDEPPVTGAARAAYRLLAEAAVASLPAWARDLLGQSMSPLRERLVGRPVGRAVGTTLRWLLADAEAVGQRRIPFGDS